MSKSTTYIYLNHYRDLKGNDYLYVGSHTWKGPVGVIDPLYKGSSSVAKQHHWVPYQVELLEVCTDKSKFREGYWIDLYCSKYGIADCAASLSRSSDWLNRYPKHGLMLNLHMNDMKNALAKVHSKEVQQKRINTMRESGILDRQIKHLSSPEVRAKAITPESIAKGKETLRKQGRLMDLVLKMVTPEAVKKASSHRDYSSILKKAVATRKHKQSEISSKMVATKKSKGSYSTRRWVKVFKDGKFVIEGYIQTCCKALCPEHHWGVGVCMKFRNSGASEVEHRGYVFVLSENPSVISIE